MRRTSINRGNPGTYKGCPYKDCRNFLTQRDSMLKTNTLLQRLIATCDFIAKKGLCPATAGNFSVRNDNQTFYISRSGIDKGNLTLNDFLLCDFNATVIAGEGRPSAETHLHAMIYQRSNETNCVLHTHSVATTVLSLLKKSDNKIVFHGYEMQKVIDGVTSHEQQLEISILDNDQDIPRLSQIAKSLWDDIKPAHGLIVRGHGLYSWGKTIHDAQRHMEGWEFLLECALHTTKLQWEKS
jgi:methylthioribulose-1-phosphate dehydratase